MVTKEGVSVDPSKVDKVAFWQSLNKFLELASYSKSYCIPKQCFIQFVE